MTPSDLIIRDIADIENAICDSNLGKITKCINNYFRLYGNEESIIACINALAEDGRRDFYLSLEEYERAVNESFVILNSYVALHFRDFIDMPDKKLLTRVVRTLIDHDRLEMSSPDVQDFCEVFLKYLSLASKKDKDVFERVVDIVTIEKESGLFDDSGNPKKEIWIKTNIGDFDYLHQLLRTTYGRNYRSLRDIFMRINSIELPDDVDSKLFCSIHDGECNEFIPAGNFFFIAFPFVNEDIEGKIREAFKLKIPELESVIAKGDFESKTILCQVCRLIMSSKFGVYILNKCMTDDQNRHLPNPNVTLELGLAMGNRKKMIMIVERGTQIIADLAGYIRIEYDNADNIPALINSHTFTSFYTEED
jgi:hypothetical protein